MFLKFRAGVAQLARATAFQAVGRGFESRFPLHAHVAQLVERILGKDEVHRFNPGRGLHVKIIGLPIPEAKEGVCRSGSLSGRSRM